MKWASSYTHEVEVDRSVLGGTHLHSNPLPTSLVKTSHLRETFEWEFQHCNTRSNQRLPSIKAENQPVDHHDGKLNAAQD